ncbi:MAG: sulfatase [SAR92 bacterium BACL16 MAG-120619-bin48]|nr:MAG: sulfatase [SAR92 bacterium BACL16 MAG-120619-bin48]
MKNLLLIFMCSLSIAFNAIASDVKPANILFIMIDDLRPELGAYGSTAVKSPNIDSLASEGVLFANAYANVPVCGASRASMMSGIRPTETRFVGYQARIDEDAKGAETLFGYLKKQGYYSQSIGKILHFPDDSKAGWSTPPWNPKPKIKRIGHRNYQSAENIASFLKGRVGPAYEATDVPDNHYFDGMIADQAITSLESASQRDQPFFMAVGFLKPHLPFTVPLRYWDLYREDDIDLASNPLMPVGAPRQAIHSWGELRKFEGIPKAPHPVPDAMAKKLVHGYLASVSYSDAQVGKLLAKLKQLDLDDNTIVILAGDHGFSLGEHGLWVKHSPFDVATRTPLIVKLPTKLTEKSAMGLLREGTSSKSSETKPSRNPGVGTAEGLVEFVDIFPTVLELLGKPKLPQLQGDSFVSQLLDVNAPGKVAVFPRWHAADVIKTDRYAMTEWFDQQGQVTARMMFDHLNDPKETVNLAEHKDYKSLVADLHEQLIILRESR